MKIIKVSPKLSDELQEVPYKISNGKILVPFYENGVAAGFPSPADDFKEQQMSLDERYITKPNSTYIVRVAGNSMYPTLHIGDFLIVRTDLELEDNAIGIISVNNNEFTVKRFDKVNKVLIADNSTFPNIPIQEEDVLLLRGVVKHLIRDF